jgi:hypothetical protein
MQEQGVDVFSDGKEVVIKKEIERNKIIEC